jgi:hypothetical protein
MSRRLGRNLKKYALQENGTSLSKTSASAFASGTGREGGGWTNKKLNQRVIIKNIDKFASYTAFTRWRRTLGLKS